MQLIKKKTETWIVGYLFLKNVIIRYTFSKFWSSLAKVKSEFLKNYDIMFLIFKKISKNVNWMVLGTKFLNQPITDWHILFIVKQQIFLNSWALAFLINYYGEYPGHSPSKFLRVLWHRVHKSHRHDRDNPLQ